MIEALVGAIRRRELSCRELVSGAIGAIEARDPGLNAVVATRFDAAVAEADALDRGGAVGPLAGMPILVKDIEDVAGMRTTWGSLLFADAPPATSDGLVPARLRAAGAIVVGKTNAPECAFEAYTSNRLFGATRNPWAPEWSPGGSSGGSGAALAAGMVPIATATDGGGSIRIPAAFCGLVGLKPTNGIVGRRPIPDWMDLSTDGPLGHSIADVRLLLGIEQGPVPGDPTALPRWQPGAPGPPERVLAAPRTVAWGALPAAVDALFTRALAALEQDLGLRVEMVEPDDLWHGDNPDRDWFTIVMSEHAHRLGRELIASRAEEMDPVFAGYMREGLAVDLETYLAARRRRFAYTRALDELLGESGVLVTPTMAIPGVRADGRMIGAEEPGLSEEACNTLVQNLSGHPALSLPAGRTPDGVPFGLQLTGPRFRDDLLLELGARWEAARPWPLLAPGYEPLGPT